MKILVADDERLAVENLVKIINRIEEAEIVCFSDTQSVLAYLSQNQVDIAFLDIEMGQMSGIELAVKCKELCPAVNIIFVTGYSQYMPDAFKLHASGYLLKPVREKDLRAELDNLRFPVLHHSAVHRVRIHTFGNFEVFVDGKPLDLPRTKSKECLAYLIDRKGARVSVSELASVLWEDRLYDSSTKNNVHQVIFTLMKALKKEGVEDIIIKNRREIAIDTSKVDCDYFETLSGNMALINTFTGEYMTNYSWAEFTLGGLVEETKVKNNRLNIHSDRQK